MLEKSDVSLLQEFAGQKSESAFAELVRRHINLVYSVALRFTGNDGDAQDVTQTVFITLARRAGGLSERVVLTGWLYETTRFTASRQLRAKFRRQMRELEASMQSISDQPDPNDVWHQLAPHLESAMSRLSERDRTLLALRYYENKTGAEAAALMGIREEAARKQTGRALEKLRRYFLAHGVTSTTAIIATALSVNSVHAAPAGLASTVASASLANAGAAGFFATLTEILLMKKTVTMIALLVLATAALTTAGFIFSSSSAGAGPVTETQLKDGLVLHLTFDQDETGGNVSDSSGKQNNGNASGVRWTSDGKKGGAYEFTKDGDQIVVPNNHSLNPDQFTLSAWIKTTTGDHYWRRIFDKSYSRGFALSVAGDWQNNKWYGQVSTEIGPGTHFALTTKRVDDGKWHHIATTFDGTVQMIYVDGQANAQFRWKQPGKIGSTDFNLVIGCNRSNLNKGDDDAGVSFRGSIDEPMMWNRALSAKEVTFLFESQK